MRTYPMRTAVPKNLVIEGSFDVDGAGAVTNVTGYGFTAAYAAAAGKWLVTFVEVGSKFVRGGMDFQASAATDALEQLGDYTAADKTLELHLWDISDTALANVAGRIHFRAVWSNWRV